MMSPGDRRAARVLALLLAAGLFVRWTVSDDVPAGAVAYAVRNQERPARDSVVARSDALGRPLGRDEKVDINRADASALDRLPGIGPALARRIIRQRDTLGDYSSLEDLQRVPGLGPRLAARLEPHAAFRSSGRKGSVKPDRQPPRVRLNRASAEELTALPGIGPTRAAAIIAFRERFGPLRSADDLTRIRGIGPATVERLRHRIRVP